MIDEEEYSDIAKDNERLRARIAELESMLAVHRLAVDVDALKARIAELEAQNARLTDCFNEHGGRYWEGRWRDEAAYNEKLKAALKPFAEMVVKPFDDLGGISKITVGDLRAARAAYLRTKDAQQP